MTNDTPVCVICLESDENEPLIILHENYKHYLHAGCYSKLDQKMTCPFCTKPFSSIQSRELLEKELSDVFDKQQALAKNLKDKDYIAIKDCVLDKRTEKYAIIDAFSLKYDITTVIDLEATSRLVIFLVCAIASEDLALIFVAHYQLLFKYHEYDTSSYHRIAIKVCVKFRLFNVLKILAACDFKPDVYASIALTKMLCLDNDIDAFKTLLAIFPDFTKILKSPFFADASTYEMADFLLTSWSETIFTTESMWKNLDFECLMLKLSNDVRPFVAVWERIRAEGFKDRFLPPPYDFKDYINELRFR